MTPGPIAPRIPVDPGPQSLQKADGEPGHPEEGLSFADLLQAMLAPGAAPGMTPDGSAPQAPAAVFERLDAAQVFNETGLFRGAAPLAKEGFAAGPPSPSAAAGPPSPSAAAVRPEIVAGAGPEQTPAPPPGAAPAAAQEPAEVLAPTARLTGWAAGSAPVSASLPPREAIRTARAVPGQPAAALQAPGRTPETARQSAAAAGRRSGTAATLVQAYLAKGGGSAAAQVSVQAVEGGISLVARADKLSREERDKLRIEIGELLARHGLNAAEIMLNGEAGPSPKGRYE